MNASRSEATDKRMPDSPSNTTKQHKNPTFSGKARSRDNHRGNTKYERLEANAKNMPDSPSKQERRTTQRSAVEPFF